MDWLETENKKIDDQVLFNAGVKQQQRAHELAMHAAYKAVGDAKDIAAAYNTAYKIVMEASNG